MPDLFPKRQGQAHSSLCLKAITGYNVPHNLETIMITVRYFAQLKENLDCAEEQLALAADIIDVDSLRTYLASRNECWQHSFEQHLMAAVNQEMAKPDTPIKAGDEVAFFPPVTGG